MLPLSNCSLTVRSQILSYWWLNWHTHCPKVANEYLFTNEKTQTARQQHRKKLSISVNKNRQKIKTVWVWTVHKLLIEEIMYVRCSFCFCFSCDVRIHSWHIWKGFDLQFYVYSLNERKNSKSLKKCLIKNANFFHRCFSISSLSPSSFFFRLIWLCVASKWKNEIQI